MRSMMSVMAVLASVFAVHTSTAIAETRHALIIANRDYRAEVGPLNNPHKDAALISLTLRDLGFKVEVVTDASRGQMLAAVERHAHKLAGDDAVGFFYYSGHGAARPRTGQNYLLPVTVTDASSSALWYDAVALDRIRELLNEHAPDAAHIIIFDACRNELRTGERGGKGFVAVPSWGGMLIAYSTDPGQTASDGDQNAPAGPYALALVEELRREPGLSASTLFGRVRVNVRQRTGNQSPWFLHGLDREVKFAASEPTPSVPSDSTQPPLSEVARVWASISDSDDVATFEVFREQYGSAYPFYDRLAERRLARLSEQALPVTSPNDPRDSNEENDASSKDKNKKTGTKVAGIRDWAVYVYEGEDGKICYAGSKPKDSSPEDQERSGVYSYVTNWVSDGIRNELSFSNGYEFKNGSKPKVQVGEREFELISRGNKAFLRDPEDERQLLELMKAAASMEVTGISDTNVKTTDTYSLYGVTDAVKKLNEECP